MKHSILALLPGGFFSFAANSGYSPKTGGILEGRHDVYGNVSRHAPAEALSSKYYKRLTATAVGLNDSSSLGNLPECGLLSPHLSDEDGTWYTHATTKHIFWEPKGCRLRRFSAFQARQCLRGRHLAFVGDSISRQVLCLPPAPPRFVSRRHIFLAGIATSVGLSVPILNDDELIT